MDNLTFLQKLIDSNIGLNINFFANLDPKTNKTSFNMTRKPNGELKVKLSLPQRSYSELDYVDLLDKIFQVESTI